MPLSVSPNRRRLVREDGTPFFYLGDTAWGLFHFLDRDEADYYLRTRAGQGFTVIQAVLIFEHDEPSAPNRYGEGALLDNDPLQPNPKFFEHADWVVRRANDLGLTVGLVPTWGDKWNQGHGLGPEVFTPENARAYGEFVGLRYRDANVIWITGGDRAIENERHLLVTRALAEGLRTGDGGTHPITFHPGSQHSSSDYVHAEPWLDFNMIQSGHDWPGNDIGARIRADWAKIPVKPTLDGEPRYEDHPIMGTEWEAPWHGYFEPQHFRHAAYAALLNGACGHTYGCHSVWQFFGATDRPAVNGARTPWHEALFLPGATQMHHARHLMESLDWLNLGPAPDLILSCDTRLDAGRTADGRTALIYFPRSVHAALELRSLRGETIRLRWFNPQTGDYEESRTIPRPRSQRTPDEPRLVVRPPGAEDWVLRLDAGD